MFVFFHIPKAAGTTVRELIAEQVRPSMSLHIDDVSRIAYQSDQWLNAHDFISGHFGAAIIPRLRPGTKKFTMLRDPVSRVRSQFRYLEYLASMDVTFNGYKTLLKGRNLAALLEDKSDPLINSLFRDTATWSLTSDYQHHYRNYEIEQSQVISTAKNNLEAMDCFGVVEDMNGSLRLLNAHFGFRIDLARAEYVRENESRSSSIASPEECALDAFIRENNPLDVELYQWAREKFDKEVLICSPASQDARTVLTEKPTIDLALYSLGGSDFPSQLTYALLSERVQAAEKVNSELALRTMELQDWAEQTEKLLGSERENVAEMRLWAQRSEARTRAERARAEGLREWAEQSDAALANEQYISAEMRLWAERSEARVLTEQENARDLRQWAERSDAALAAEQTISAEMRLWAERSEARVVAEQKNARDLRLWAERSDAALANEKNISAEMRLWAERSDSALAAEKKVTQHFRAIVNSRWRLFLRLIRLNNKHD